MPDDYGISHPYGTTVIVNAHGSYEVVSDPNAFPWASGAQSAVVAQIANQAARQDTAMGTGIPSDEQIMQRAALVTPASYAAYLNAQARQQDIEATQQRTAQLTGSGYGAGGYGGAIGVGETYVTTPQGIVTFPSSSSPLGQAYQNIAIFGGLAPGIQTITPELMQIVQRTGNIYDIASPGNVAAANKYIGAGEGTSQLGYFTPGKPDKPGYEWAVAYNNQPTVEAQREFAARNDDPLARIQYYTAYPRTGFTSEEFGKTFQGSAVYPEGGLKTILGEEGVTKTASYQAKGYDALTAADMAVDEMRINAIKSGNMRLANELLMSERTVGVLGQQMSNTFSDLAGKGWTPYAGNPFEAMADTLQEIEAGYPSKATGPLSYTTPLPEYMGKPVGIADVQWQQAIAVDKNLPVEPFTGSFAPGIALAAARVGQIYPGIATESPLGPFQIVEGLPYKAGMTYAEQGRLRVEPTALSPEGVGTQYINAPAMIAPSYVAPAQKEGIWGQAMEARIGASSYDVVQKVSGGVASGFDYGIGTTYTPAAKYEYRTDPLAVALEGAVAYGDTLLLGLATPGADLLKSKGQAENQALVEADALLNVYKQREPSMVALGNTISSERSAIDVMLTDKLNSEGKFTGTGEEYTAYRNALSKLNTDVSIYNKYGTDYETAVAKGVASGAYIKTDKGYAVNPDLEHPYGAFSDWSRSVKESLRGGVTEADIIRYESSDAYKKSGFAMQFGESSWKAITDPVGLSQKALQGVEIYAGIGALGAGVGALATPAAAEGGVGASVLSRGALGLQTFFQNPYIQGAVGAAFAGQAYYEGTERLTNLPAAGGTTINMAAMLAGGIAPEGAASFGEYSAIRFAVKPETQVRVQPIESGSVTPSEAGASGVINYEAPYQILQLPRYNVFGREVIFPRLSTLSETESGTIRTSQPIEIENLGKYTFERTGGSPPSAQVWSRESSIVIDYFKGQPLGRFTTETNIGALATSRPASLYYDEAITQLKQQGAPRTSQGIQNLANELAMRDLELSEPIVAYRSNGGYVARGESLPTLIDEALQVRARPDATAREFSLGKADPFDYINRISSQRVGTNPRENYNTFVERISTQPETGIVSTTMMRDRAIINDLVRESTGTVPRTTEFAKVYDKYGNPIAREEGTAEDVDITRLEDIGNTIIGKGGEVSYAHYHPGVGFSVRGFGEAFGTDIWNIYTGQRKITEPSSIMGYIRSKSPRSMFYETPSGADIVISSENPQGVASEFIANRQGVFMYGQPSYGWGGLRGLGGMRDEALIDYYFGGNKNAIRNIGSDIISRLEILGSRVEYTRHERVYSEGEQTTTINKDVSEAMKGYAPRFIQRGVSEVMDRIALKDQLLEFESTNIYKPIPEYSGFGGGLRYGANTAKMLQVGGLTDTYSRGTRSVISEARIAGEETTTAPQQIKAFPIESSIRVVEPIPVRGIGSFPVTALSLSQIQPQTFDLKASMEFEKVSAYSMGSDVVRAPDVSQADRVTPITMITPALASITTPLTAFRQESLQTPISRITPWQLERPFVDITPSPTFKNIPSVPKTPTPFTPVIPGIGKLPYSGSAGGGGGARKRRRPFKELFPMGLDVSFFGAPIRNPIPRTRAVKSKKKQTSTHKRKR